MPNLEISNSQLPTPNFQNGQSSVYIIIFIMVIILAIFLTGGASSLFSGNVASPVTDTPATQ